MGRASRRATASQRSRTRSVVRCSPSSTRSDFGSTGTADVCSRARGSTMGNADTALHPRPISGDRRFDFRILITGALIAGLCAMFWVGSRYPSLQGKASADPNEALSTPLGFERFFPEPPADQRLRHIAWTSVEWALTNRQGMTFGLLLAGAMLTIVPLLRRTRGGKFTGAIQG